MTPPKSASRLDGTRSRRTSRTCGVRIKGGRFCANGAGWGTDHEGVGPCKRHGGNSPTGLKSVGQRLAHMGIMDPDVSPGDIVQIEPHNGLVWAVWLSAGDAAYWNRALAESNAELLEAIDAEDAEAEKEARKKIKECFAQQRTAVREMRSASKMALDAGLQERQVQMAERMGSMIAAAIDKVVGDLDLSPLQERRLPKAIQAAMLELEAPGSPKTAPRPKAALQNFRVEDVIDVD